MDRLKINIAGESIGLTDGFGCGVMKSEESSSIAGMLI